MKKFILVTGASSGIGKAITGLLYTKDYIIIAGVRRKEDGEALKEEFPDLFYTILDITNDEDINNSYRYVKEITENNGLYGLINNAGIAVSGMFEDVKISEYRRQFEVNVFGTIKITKKFLPLLKLSKGYIITIGSLTGFFAMPYLSPYSMSKHSLEALSDSLRVELKQYDIKVVLIEPGTIKTPIWDKAIEDINENKNNSSDNKHMLTLAQNANKEGIDSTVVAKAVYKQLQKNHPDSRVLIGNEAYLLFLIRRFLPAFMRDKLIALYLGINKHHE